MSRKTWLSGAQLEHLVHIEHHINDLWNNHEDENSLALYGPKHCQRVEEAIYKLIPDDRGDRYEQLNSDNRFVLLAAAWLHSTGIATARGFSFPKNLEGFPERSATYVQSKRSELKLTDVQAQVLHLIVQNFRNVAELRNRAMIGGIRIQLLATYLSLADIIHRHPSDEMQALSSPFKIALPEENWFHWLKGQLITELTARVDKMRIEIDLSTPFAEDSDWTRALEEYVETAIDERLYPVRDILVRDNVAVYMEVKVKTSAAPTQAHGRALEFEKLFSKLILHERVSSSELADTIIQTLIDLGKPQSPLLQAGHGNQPLVAVTDYYEHVLKPLVATRNCHTLLRKLKGLVSDCIERANDPGTSEEECIRALCETLNRVKTDREQALETLSEYARPFLVDGRGILLFGFSRSVLRALKDVPDQTKERTEVFVCTAASKDRLNHRDELAYSDGGHYADRLKEAGFKDIKLIPDIAVANVMSRGKVRKVVLGANGVETRTGRFVHTAGHLNVVDLAGVYEVPVYVLADSWKFEEKIATDATKLRRNVWLDRKMEAQLKRDGEETISLLNPREDIVDVTPRSQVYMLVTDKGAFPASQIPEDIETEIRI